MPDTRISVDGLITPTGAEYIPLILVGSPVTAGSFSIGTAYVILSVGTTNFTLIGAASNTVGVGFVATGAGTGTGTAGPTDNKRALLSASGMFSTLLIENSNLANGTTGTVDNYVDSQNPATAFPIFATRQSRGTKASPAAVQTGTVLGAYAFYGYNGSALVLGGTIQAIATENWSGSARGTKIQIAITPNGSTTQSFAATIDQDGTITVNGGLVFTQSTAPYPFAISSPQTTAYAASQVIGAHRMACAGSIPANFGSYGGMSTTAGGSAVATGATVISIERSVAATPLTFTQIGTITIGAGTAGVSAKATAGGVAITLAADDIIRAVMPSSADATFAGAMLSIIARRT